MIGSSNEILGFDCILGLGMHPWLGMIRDSDGILGSGRIFSSDSTLDFGMHPLVGWFLQLMCCVETWAIYWHFFFLECKLGI
jgi:hypothetical protein